MNSITITQQFSFHVQNGTFYTSSIQSSVGVNYFLPQKHHMGRLVFPIDIDNSRAHGSFIRQNKHSALRIYITWRLESTSVMLCCWCHRSSSKFEKGWPMRFSNKEKSTWENHTHQPNTSACFPGTSDSSCSSRPVVYICIPKPWELGSD